MKIMTINKDDPLHELAAAYGLERILEIDPELFSRARKEAAAISRRAEGQLKLTDEPANICRFSPSGLYNE